MAIKIINRKRKVFITVLLSITLVSIVVRLLVFHELYQITSFISNPPRGTDMEVYLSLSARICAGTYHTPFYFQPFYYVIFLPLINFLFGPGIIAIILMQSLLSGVTVYLVGLCGAKIRGRIAGIIGALIFAFANIPVLYTSFVLIATLNEFLCISLLWFLLSVRNKNVNSQRKEILLLGGTGLVCSFLILTRANAVLFLPVVFIGISGYNFKSFKRTKTFPSKKGIALFIILFLCSLMPFSIYNSLCTGKFSAPSTGGAVGLALMNNPEAPPGDQIYTDTMRYWISSQEVMSVKKRIIRWFREEPLVFSELAFRKLLLFWDRVEIYDNLKSIQKSIHSSVFLTYLAFIPSFILLMGVPSFLILSWNSIRSHMNLTIPALLIFVYWLSMILIRNQSRYRVVIFPFMAICTAIAVVEYFKHLRRFHFLRVITAFTLSFFIVFNAYSLYRNHVEKDIFRILQPAGNCIRLDNNGYVLLDHGPAVFGGWLHIPLESNNILEKDFKRIEGVPISNAVLQIIFRTLNTSQFRLKINGKIFYFTPPKIGDNLYSVHLPPMDNGKIKITLLSPISDGFACLIDRQRNYNRTSINRKDQPGELVCRLLITE